MTATAPPTTPDARDEQGRFAAGHRGGPGNPFARQVAALRFAWLKSFTPEDMMAVAAAVLVRAKGGDMAAARLALSYTLGKPAPAVNPDRLDIDEWQQYKEEAPMLGESPALIKSPTPDFPLNAVRLTRPCVADQMRQALRDNLLAPDPSPNGDPRGDKGATPSPNGHGPGRAGGPRADTKRPAPAGSEGPTPTAGARGSA